ncbi:MAG: adenosylcobinamide-phosphate synthase CbiB [Lachnospiraceae bacterium]
METLIAIVLGFIIDLFVGDPHSLPHPVSLIGTFISKGEKDIRKLLPKHKNGELIGGVLLNIIILSICFFLPTFLLVLAKSINSHLKIMLETLFCYQIFATKSLKTESMRVYKYLSIKDIAQSRKYLSWIVGRDTKHLEEKEITKAVVETIAENTTDGVIAPMIYMLIGGAPLGFLYKGVNTLDSMIGYKNETYLYFGKFSAKVDDFFNYIPAIVAARLMIIASFLLNLNYKNAYKIYKRDRRNHTSPNSAKTESVCAGALGVQLAGDAYYFGKLYTKKTIGDPIQEIQVEDIKIANKLMYATSICGIILLGFIKVVLEVLF